MSENIIDQDIFGELKNMVGEDFVGEIIDAFLEDAPHLISQLESSLAANNVDGFRRAAHSLKSNSASFGAHKLSEQAKELEYLARDNKLNEVGDKIGAVKTGFALVEVHLKEIRPTYD